MIKTAIVSGAALGLLHGIASPAIAGPYVNVETNSGFSGSDYSATSIESHVGYESALGKSSSWYIQGGPAFILPDTGESTQAASGKVGVSTALNSDLDAYGEFAAITADNYDFNSLSSNVKLGLKYTF
jgi:hypothetical protein